MKPVALPVWRGNSFSLYEGVIISALKSIACLSTVGAGFGCLSSAAATPVPWPSSGDRWSLSSAVMLTSTRSYVQYGGVTAGSR